ncbi:Metallo-dependent phosphatase-like protein [Kockovaella imperatae]|uniref:Metallo-dependent phosphatase-like protein n=1 Tax=Kockovaella imperatae TaxID=4999 RepID=A0A1Y1UQ09_9TREE|nr:Metallo-dependent phosphatase-like protein [Kockovaella imperatae]ORX40150.1 Metallo-dependent phosphatase-like protein [Kockovaella imperatae]
MVSTSSGDGTDGATRYLGVTRGKNTCLTSVVPVASSQVFPRPYYQIVQDAHGNPADFNEGATNAVPIYVYTSSETELNPPSAPTLSFNSTGSFRIAHFSDLHHSDIAPICLDEPFEFRANCTEQFSFTFMERALDLTRPDLVIINGDLFARNKRQKDDITYPLLTQGALLKAVYPILNRSLPFAVTWGNHDAEGSLLREELQREMSRLPGYVGSNVASLDGQGNYQLDILDRDGDSKMKLWFFDSRSYTYFPLNGSTTGQSGGVHRNQVEWFERESRGLEMNGMAFFHIPLGQMSGSLGLNSSAELGVHSEDVCSQGHECSNTPDLADNDTGFFDAIVNGNHIKATFSGHDHSNDFSTSVKGVTFTYDGSAGYTAYSTGNDPNYNREMRVIDIVSWGESATTYKVIDDILKGTVHRNTSEPILTLY